MTVNSRPNSNEAYGSFAGEVIDFVGFDAHNGIFGLPMIFRLIEYRPICVKILLREIPMRVLRKPK